MFIFFTIFVVSESDSSADVHYSIKKRTQTASLLNSHQKKGIPISFGHQSWDLSYHMMLGIRLAVAEVTSSQAKDGERPLEPKDFELQVEFVLKE